MRTALRIRSAIALALLLSSLRVSAARAEALPEPCSGSGDWIQLNSAEWLKGELRRMRGSSLEFASTKLKSQTFKWRDVVTVCMSQVARYVREDKSVVQGIGQVRDSEVRVLAATGEVVFARSDLLAILPGAGSEFDHWSLALSLGGDVNTGNTDQTSFNSSLLIRREGDLTRGSLGYYGSYGSANQIQNVNRQRIESSLDYFIWRHVYLTLIEWVLVHDEFQNVALRATPSAGVGWQIYDRSGLEWRVETGLGYQYLQNISVQPGMPENQNDFAVRASTHFKWTIVNNLKLSLDHDTIIVATDIGQSTNYSRATLTYEITNHLNLQTTAVHNRTWQPVANSLGQVPDKDDFLLIFALGIDIW